MATGKIKQEICSTDYYKSPDGLFLQWGSTTSLSVSFISLGGGLYGQTITLVYPYSFATSFNRVWGAFQYDTGTNFPFSQRYGTSASEASITVYDTSQRSGNKGRLLWMAMGYWKNPN